MTTATPKNSKKTAKPKTPDLNRGNYERAAQYARMASGRLDEAADLIDYPDEVEHRRDAALSALNDALAELGA